MTFFQFHPNVRLRILISFITNTLGNMVTPFMAVYFARTMGTTVAGAAAAISIAVGLVCATIGGHYADRIGRKKMMVLAEALSTLAYGVMALANSPWLHSPTLTLLMTMLISAAWGLSKPAVEAMLIDVSAPDTRKAIYRINYWCNNLAISVAGMIGGYFFSDYLLELLIVVGVMSVVALAVTAIYIQETMPERQIAPHTQHPADAPAAAEMSIVKRYIEVLRDRRFMIYILAGVLSVSVEMNLTGYIGIRLANEVHQTAWLPGWSAAVDGLPLVGYLRTENTIAVVLLSLFVGRMLKGRSDHRVMLAALLCNILGYTYLVFGNQPSLLVLLMLLATAGELTYVPIKQALLVQLVPDHARSTYMAVNSMTNRAAQIISGLNVIIGGFVSPGGMALLILLTGLAGIALLASILPSLQEKQAKTSSLAV
ncbi:MFS transporter [Paenibacillus aestuarii]|uniref:MFS transporter n=1 Tax=Paenibacillus aestuarii TaxID=516965 RepID=A0ABW0KGK7_9BACL|nr:MFS transporter [Paenibacillus aestuarii]